MRSAPLVSQKICPNLFNNVPLRVKTINIIVPPKKMMRCKMLNFLRLNKSIPTKKKMIETRIMRKDRRFIGLSQKIKLSEK